MKYEWHFGIDSSSNFGIHVRCGLWATCGDKAFCVTVNESGIIALHEIKENEEIKPFIILSNVLGGRIECNAMFQAMADGLKDAGYLQKINEVERITEKALSEERKINLDYFKKLNTELIESIINKKEN